MEFVGFAFAKFGVAPCLERTWLTADDYAPGEPDFRDWYITAAQGRSLYREQAAEFLTRAETHHFLTAPAKIESALAALWFAIAMAETGDTKAALEIARTRLVLQNPRDRFWKDVARFFTRHRTTVQEMDEMIRYMAGAREAEPDFSLAGRSLAALRRRRQGWLRLCAAGAVAGDLRWSGAMMTDAVYESGSVVWRVSQIKTAIRLLEEGERMHHCVFAYRHECAAGHSSIWSVSTEDRGMRHRRLTIEVGSNGAILQCRGAANRQPTKAERDIIRRWADERCLTWRDDPDVWPDN